jgi:hypothetical protein
MRRLVAVLTISLCAFSGSAGSGIKRDLGPEGTQDPVARAGARGPLGNQGPLGPQDPIGVHDLCHLCAGITTWPLYADLKTTTDAIQARRKQ